MPFWNNFFLMIILNLDPDGFAMVIFRQRCAAYLKKPSRLPLSRWRKRLAIFWRIMVPQILGKPSRLSGPPSPFSS